ncbi:MAG TPA: hypothetical protein VL334_11300 [Anaerolineae bacterium]|nr:hypothetical protein [Anaerolineae bacterium]
MNEATEVQIEKENARLTSISRARTVDEIGEFWDNHSLADYGDETEEVDFEIRSARRRPVALAPEVLSPVAATDLAQALSTLGVPFVAGGSRATAFATPRPAVLLASLAASDEARLRLALIPLLLRHSEFARDAAAALRLMAPTAQICFKCYYTAAGLLQHKYRERLEALSGSVDPLPDQFSAELGVPGRSYPDEALQLLADRQRELTGRSINWRGTYEHGAKRLLQTLERRKQWQV